MTDKYAREFYITTLEQQDPCYIKETYLTKKIKQCSEEGCFFNAVPPECKRCRPHTEQALKLKNEKNKKKLKRKPPPPE